jgi:hypothetical protein
MDRSDDPFPFERHQPEPSPAAVRLAAALAERLDAVVPRPLRVQAEGGWVSVYHGVTARSSTGVAPVLDQDAGPVEEDDERWSFEAVAAGVAWNALSSVQDEVAETTTEPWPRLPRGGMAMPGTCTDGEQIFLWYGPAHGSEEGAVLSLPPIPLAELGGQR